LIWSPKEQVFPPSYLSKDQAHAQKNSLQTEVGPRTRRRQTREGGEWMNKGRHRRWKGATTWRLATDRWRGGWRGWSSVLEAYFSFYEFLGCLTQHLNNQALLKVENGTPPRNARGRLTQGSAAAPRTQIQPSFLGHGTED
jgi:hypothetical protein